MKSTIMVKYENLSTPIKASFWFLICGFMQKGMSFITTPIFTRLLSTSEYGKYSIYNSWYAIISIFATFNLSYGVYMQGLVKFKNDRDVFTSSLQGLTTTIVLTCGTIYILFNKLWNKLFDLSIVLMMAMFIDMLAMAAFSFWANRQRVDYKYEKLVILSIFRAIVNPMIGIFAVTHTNNKVEARVLSSIVIDLITFAYLYFIQAKKGKQFYNKKYWMYALSFNFPLIPHYLSTIVLSQSDKIIIKYLCGSSKAGIYSVAYSLSQVMVIFNSALLNTLNPWIYKKINLKEYDEIGKVSYFMLIIIAFVNFLLVAIAPEIIDIMAPREYHKAIWVIPPIVISVFFMFMYSLFADFEFYFEKTKFIMLASVTSAGLNILLNFIFIKHFGFIAAGYTTLACYLLYAFAHYLFMRKINYDYMNSIKIYNGKLILFISLIFIIACTIIVFFYNCIIIRYVILGFIFLIILLKKDKVRGLIRKIKLGK